VESENATRPPEAVMLEASEGSMPLGTSDMPGKCKVRLDAETYSNWSIAA